MQSTWNLDQDHNIDKLMFPENFIKIREGTFWNFASKRDPSKPEILSNFQKTPSRSRILMEFSGSISFINVMILSKFRVGCVTLANFGGFLGVGWCEIFAKSRHAGNAGKPPGMTFFPEFFLNCFLDTKWHPKKGSKHVLTIGPFFHPIPPTPTVDGNHVKNQFHRPRISGATA